MLDIVNVVLWWLWILLYYFERSWCVVCFNKQLTANCLQTANIVFWAASSNCGSSFYTYLGFFELSRYGYSICHPETWIELIQRAWNSVFPVPSLGFFPHFWAILGNASCDFFSRWITHPMLFHSTKVVLPIENTSFCLFFKAFK